MAERVEKRTYIRLSIKANVRHRIVKLPAELSRRNLGPEDFNVTKNLSASGLVFVAKEQVQIGAILELKIELPGVEEPIECLGRVVRVEKVEIEKVYDIAVCFLDLSGVDRMKLDQFVQEEIS